MKNIVLVVICVLIIIFLFLLKQATKKRPVSSNQDTQLPNDMLGKKIRFKMMSYQEALEASKQFIYNITKAVMQKFTPDAQQSIVELGKKLLKNGVKYLHVVDVAALSAEKEKQLSHLQQREQERGKGR